MINKSLLSEFNVYRQYIKAGIFTLLRCIPLPTIENESVSGFWSEVGNDNLDSLGNETDGNMINDIFDGIKDKFSENQDLYDHDPEMIDDPSGYGISETYTTEGDEIVATISYDNSAVEDFSSSNGSITIPDLQPGESADAVTRLTNVISEYEKLLEQPSDMISDNQLGKIIKQLELLKNEGREHTGSLEELSKFITGVTSDNSENVSDTLEEMTENIADLANAKYATIDREVLNFHNLNFFPSVREYLEFAGYFTKKYIAEAATFTINEVKDATSFAKKWLISKARNSVMNEVFSTG